MKASLYKKKAHVPSIVKKSFPPLPPLFLEQSPGEPKLLPSKNSAKRPLVSPTPSPSSWDEGKLCVTGHLILRSFKADSRLWKETAEETVWFVAVPHPPHPQRPGP